MSTRIFWIILIGGVLVSAAGYLPLMVYVPSVVVPGWEGTSPTPQATLGLAALALALLLLTGLIAGWLSGAPTRWSALGTGALAGLLTALIAEAVFGGVAAGLWGARNLVAHGLTPAETHTQYIFLVAESVQSIIVVVHASVVISALAGALLGGLGGALSSLLHYPIKPALQAGPAVYILALTAASFSLTRVVTVYSVLQKVMQNVASELALTMPYPISTIFDLPLAVALLWWLFWLWMSWRTFKFAPPSRLCAGFSTLGLSLLGWMAVLPLILLGDRQFVVNSLGWMVESPGWLAALLCMVWNLLLIALTFGLVALIRRRPQGRVRKFFERQGEARLMAWIVLGITVLTGLLTLLISPEPWRKLSFSGGIVAGLGLALLGVRASRAIQPTEEAVLKVGDILTTSGLGALCANLAVTLTSLAPMALVQLIISTLIYLVPEATLSGGEFSNIQQLVRIFMENAPLLMGSLVLVLPLLAGLISVPLWRLWQRVTQRCGI